MRGRSEPASVRCGYLVRVAVLTAPTAVAARVGMTALVGAMSAAAASALVSVPATGVAAAARMTSVAAAAASRVRGCLFVLVQRVILHDVLLPDVAPQ